MEQNILITVCARGGSKGLPNKNIHQVDGKHLIGYTIETAHKLAEQLGAQVILSTDSDEITKIAALYGLASDYKRPAELASDSAGKIAVLYHVLAYHESKTDKQCTHLIDLDVSSPLRTVNEVLDALKVLNNNKGAVNIFSVSEARKNPYFNMVEKNENGFFTLSKDGTKFFTRQSANQVFELNASFYIYKKSYFESGYKSATTDKSLAYVMDHICFDIDNEIEMHFLEFLLRQNKLKFEL